MSRAHRFALPFLALCIALIPLLSSVAEDAKRDFGNLERGMTPEQVRQLLGVPKQIARQILYRRYREQWIYDAPIPIRLTFDCPRGQKPRLLSPALRPKIDG